MAIFEISLKKTLDFEGDYSNHQHDSGGETYKGISRKHWPEWEGWVYVDEKAWDSVLLEKAVEKFYKTNFWTPLNLDSFSQPIANQVFDIAVNMGKHFAGCCLQMSLSPFGAIDVDGKIGPKTLGLYQAIPLPNKDLVLTKSIVFFRVQRYLTIVLKDSTQKTFLTGWIRRTYEL